MFTLTSAVDNVVFLIARSMYKHTPEDARRIENELIEMRRQASGDPDAPTEEERVPVHANKE